MSENKPASMRFSLLSVYRALIRREVVGLFYHAVAAEPLPHIDPIYPHRPVDLFEQDLSFLKSNFHPIPYEAVQEQRLAGKPVGPNAVHLSFDDGFRECFSVARPLLLRYEIPATFFIATDFIDNQRMYYRNKAALCIASARTLDAGQLGELYAEIERHFGRVITDLPDLADWILTIPDDGFVDEVCEVCGVDWVGYLKNNQPYLTTEQIKQLAAEGFTIGAHSCRHIKLNRLSQAEIEAEIISSCEIIREIAGSSQVPFSFPNSGAGLNRELLERLRRGNPHIGLYFDTKGLNKDRAFIVNRVWVEAARYNPSGTASLDAILKHTYENYLFETVTRKRRLA